MAKPLIEQVLEIVERHKKNGARFYTNEPYGPNRDMRAEILGAHMVCVDIEHEIRALKSNGEEPR